MQRRRTRSLIAASLAGALALAACGSDTKTASNTAAPVAATTAPAATSAATGTTTPAATTAPAAATTAPAGAAGALKAVCPATVVIQTDWNPEGEHGFLYNMIGPDYTIDKAKVSVTGTLVSGGADTGVKIEVRSGGPAIGFGTVTAQMYTDDSILLGFVYTDEAI